jgi:hypothetical protein
MGRVADIASRGIPEKYDLSAVRGDSFQVVFRMYSEVDACGYGSLAQTLTGLTGQMRVRPATDHPLSYSFAVAVDDTAGSGRVTCSATSEETLLMPETGVWDLELSDGASLRKTLVRGTWRLLRDHSY